MFSQRAEALKKELDPAIEILQGNIDAINNAKNNPQDILQTDLPQRSQFSSLKKFSRSSNNYQRKSDEFIRNHEHWPSAIGLRRNSSEELEQQSNPSQDELGALCKTGWKESADGRLLENNILAYLTNGSGQSETPHDVEEALKKHLDVNGFQEKIWDEKYQAIETLRQNLISIIQHTPYQRAQVTHLLDSVSEILLTSAPGRKSKPQQREIRALRVLLTHQDESNEELKKPKEELQRVLTKLCKKEGEQTPQHQSTEMPLLERILSYILDGESASRPLPGHLKKALKKELNAAAFKKKERQERKEIFTELRMCLAEFEKPGVLGYDGHRHARIKHLRDFMLDTLIPKESQGGPMGKLQSLLQTHSAKFRLERKAICEYSRKQVREKQQQAEAH